MSRTLGLTTIDANITGGNVVALDLAVEARARGWRVVVYAPEEGPLVARLLDAGAHVQRIAARRTFRLDTAARFARVLRRDRVSILHTHEPLPGTVLARLGACAARVPCVSHVHARETFHPSPALARVQRALYRWTSRHACAQTIAVSSAVRESALAAGAPPSTTRVILNGVRTGVGSGWTREQARSRLGLPAERPLVLHVGRLCESKGQARLLEAIALLPRPRPAVLLVGRDIAGGLEAVRLERLAARLGLADDLRHMEHVPDLDVAYAAADVLALPSEIEGLPLVVLEAMSAGRVVVASPVDGVPEAVVDGKTGLLVHHADIGGLSRALQRLISDPAVAREMGEAGRAKQVAEFSTRAMMDATFQLYEEILSGRST